MTQVLIAGFGRKGHAVGDIPGKKAYCTCMSREERGGGGGRGRGEGSITAVWFVVGKMCWRIFFYPGLLTPSFVACSTNVGEGMVKLSHVQ